MVYKNVVYKIIELETNFGYEIPDKNIRQTHIPFAPGQVRIETNEMAKKICEAHIDIILIDEALTRSIEELMRDAEENKEKYYNKISSFE